MDESEILTTGGSHTISLPIRVADTSLIVDTVSFPDEVEPDTQETMEITVRNLADTRFRNIDVRVQPPSTGDVTMMDSSRKRIRQWMVVLLKQCHSILYQRTGS